MPRCRTERSQRVFVRPLPCPCPCQCKPRLHIVVTIGTVLKGQGDNPSGLHAEQCSAFCRATQTQQHRRRLSSLWITSCPVRSGWVKGVNAIFFYVLLSICFLCPSFLSPFFLCSSIHLFSSPFLSFSIFFYVLLSICYLCPSFLSPSSLVVTQILDHI